MTHFDFPNDCGSGALAANRSEVFVGRTFRSAVLNGEKDNGGPEGPPYGAVS
jgi:hypothetical protein